MTKSFTRFFSVPIDEDLVIEVEFGLTKGIQVPFVVRLMAEVEVFAFRGSTAPILTNHPTGMCSDFMPGCSAKSSTTIWTMAMR